MRLLRRIAMPMIGLLLVVLAVVLWGESAADIKTDDGAVSDKMPVEGERVVFEQYDSTAQQPWTVVAETEYLTLSIRETDGTIRIQDRRTESLWLSAVDKADENLPQRLNDVWTHKLSSLIEFSYFDIRNNTGIPIESNPYQEDTFLLLEKTKNGVQYKYSFSQAQIQICVQIELIDDRLVVKIPFDGIMEYGAYRLTEIKLLPAFGGAGPNEEGYVMYPDGCGAISFFDSSKQVKSYEQIRLNMYGSETPDIIQEQKDDRRGTKQAMLPVYGMKRGDSAYLAVVDEGSADSEIIYSPAGYVVDLNRIHAAFVYRRVIDMSILSSGKESQKILRYQENMEDKNIQMSYIFLSNDEADYSGMAGACREHLIRNSLIPENGPGNNEPYFALNLLMGIKENRGFVKEYHTMTSFTQAGQIIDELSGKWNGRFLVHLSGWGKDGFDVLPTSYKIDKRIGGDKGLLLLAKTVDDIGGRVFLLTDISSYRKSDGGFSLKNDVVYLGNTLQASDQTGTFYRLRYDRFFDLYAHKYISLAERFDIGIVFEGLGSQLYEDYLDGLSRGQMFDKIGNELRDHSQAGVQISGEGNLYMLRNISHLYSLPDSGSGYILNDTEIPFYQMVINGIIPYIGEPGNLAHDLQWQKLRWIEQGSIPNFYVTYTSSEKLKFTSFNSLFSSSYEKWNERIEEIMLELYPLAKKTAGSRIIHHEVIQKDLVEIEYENKIRILINYGNTDVDFEGSKIGAMDHLIFYSTGADLEDMP